jgi:hypothetical protein
MELSQLEIPKDMFKELPKGTTAHLYLLSKETIAINFETSQEIAQKSIWNGKIHVKESDKAYIFGLPKMVINFYQITPNNFSVSVSQKTDIVYVDIE